jgi:hypothetical protein
MNPPNFVNCFQILFWGESLRGVAQRGVRIIVNFDHDAVCADGDPCTRQWPNEMAFPGSMGSVDDNR